MVISLSTTSIKSALFKWYRNKTTKSNINNVLSIFFLCFWTELLMFKSLNRSHVDCMLFVPHLNLFASVFDLEIRLIFISCRLLWFDFNFWDLFLLSHILEFFTRAPGTPSLCNVEWNIFLMMLSINPCFLEFKFYFMIGLDWYVNEIYYDVLHRKYDHNEAYHISYLGIKNNICEA